ncbi:SDR family NAD(P)-dependent oxidoreductase [Bermanella sp. R86510]|uniref:SDR family NAD(P)-dependent oxidoreductase n=1 Tax=unclassified Bermanella TaxID=2627862 RepID=UPI0037C6E5EA
MTSIVIGASSTIAQAVINQLLESGQYVHAISQHPRPNNSISENLHWWVCHYGEHHIDELVDVLAGEIRENIEHVIICNGQLHADGINVEKKLDDIQEASFHQILNSNALIPTLWLRSLLPLLRKQHTKIAVFSARVGSIGDNRLGGWYSYRASKAALNMLLKTAAIEYARSAKGVKLVAFHPGTTDTPLSKPFQANVPEDKLFTPEFVASQLLDILETKHADGELSFVDWDGKDITW